MEVEKPMNNTKRRIFSSMGWKFRGMALPLVILLVLVGFVFVGVGAYVVKNLFWSSQATVVQAKLYNAAQSGVQWGMGLLLENADQLETDILLFDGNPNLDSIRARTKAGAILDEMMAPPVVDSSISVTVDILDCNYDLNGHSRLATLPPIVHESGGTGSGVSGIPEGTSAIIDPSRVIPMSGGGGPHRFVIRATASKGSRNFQVEAMVVISQ